MRSLVIMLAILASCGKAAAPEVPFRSMSTDDLNRLYSVCPPAKLDGDPVQRAASFVPQSLAAQLGSPVMRQCVRKDSPRGALHITFVRDEQSGIVSYFNLGLDVPVVNRRESLDEIASLFEPWAKVVTAKDVMDVMERAIASPGDATAAHLDAPDRRWRLSAFAHATAGAAYVDVTFQAL